jgi:DNA polymerase-3 subunit epsilon
MNGEHASKAYGERSAQAKISALDAFAAAPGPKRRDGVAAFVAFDVAAVGYTQDVVEIVAVRYACGAEVAAYSTLVSPGRAVPAEELEGTGISPSMLARAPGLKDVIWAFDAFSKDAALLAHRDSYNVWLMHRAYEKVDDALVHPTIDAFPFARRVFSILRRRYPYPDYLLNDFMTPRMEPYRAVECARLSGGEYLRALEELFGTQTARTLSLM